MACRKGFFPPPLPPPKPSREQWAVLKFFIPFLLPPRRSPFGLCARYEGQKENRLEPPSFLAHFFCIQDPRTADWRNCFYRSLDPPPPTPPLPNTGVPKGAKREEYFLAPGLSRAPIERYDLPLRRKGAGEEEKPFEYYGALPPPSKGRTIGSSPSLGARAFFLCGLQTEPVIKPDTLLDASSLFPRVSFEPEEK